MKLHQLKIDNFMRLVAVDVDLSDRGNLIQITGRNGAGKSSLLDAIQAALGGGSAIPDRPIRDGQTRASVELDLGDVTVRRAWTSDQRSTLAVEAKDGAVYRKPQEFLDALIGRLTFDPMDFLRGKPRDQAETLRKIAGLDFAELDARRTEAFAARTDASRHLKAIQATAKAMPYHPDAPSKAVDVDSLMTNYQAAIDIRSANAKIRRQAEDADARVSMAEADVENAERRLAKAKADLETLKKSALKANLGVSGLLDPDANEIAAQMGSANATNDKVRANEAWHKKAAEEIDALDRVGELTATIDAVDMEKAGLLAAARFPVAGLDLDGDTVLFDRLPLDQASQSRRLIVSFAIAASLNPQLKLVLVRDTPMLDPDSLKVIAAEADARGMQVLMEVVRDPSEGVGIVIEDGMVLAPADALPW